MDGVSKSSIPPRSKEAATPVRPIVPSDLPISFRATRRPVDLLKQVRGPLTTKRAVDLLGKATSRDHVLEVLIGYTRQFFDFTALFMLKGDLAETWAVSVEGGPLDMLEFEISLSRPGAVATTREKGVARIVKLDATEADLQLAMGLGRVSRQPAVLAPVNLRGRPVLMLYGDRAGEGLALADVPELLGFVPRVADALETVILRQKLGDFGPSATSKRELRPSDRQELGRRRAPFRPSAAPPAEGPERALATLGAPRSAPPPPTSSIPVGDGLAFADGPAPAAAPRSARFASQPLTRDTIVDSDPPLHLDDEIVQRSIRSAPPGSVPPPSVREAPSVRRSERPGGRLSDSPELLVEEVDDEDVSDEVAGLWHEEDSSEVEIPPDPPPAPRGDPRGEGPPSSSEERIVFPVDVAPPPRVDENASVIVNMGSDVEGLVRTLLETDANDWSGVDAVQHAGVAVLPVLVREFPGPLFFDPDDPEAPWPTGRDVSAVARALVSFRDVAIPYGVSLVDRDEAVTRFCAILVAFDIPDATFVMPIGKRALDDDERTRKIALRWLREHERFADPFARLLETFRAVAKAPKKDPELRTRAVEALGYLRDMGALRPLIALLGEEPELVRQAARMSLARITAQDFGVSRSVWDQWADQNLGRHRIEWLIDSLDHNDARLRKEAGDELQRLTHQYLGYHPRLSKKERAAAQRKYRDWWESEGRYEVG